MTLKQRIIDLNAVCPELTARMAADALGCPVGSLTAYSSELKLKWAPAHRWSTLLYKRAERLNRIRANIALMPSRSMFAWPDEKRAA